ncbi:polyribonucleotide nucleotidyltransferase, partial [Candidatus Woesebacteria bacterium]|nr:polyribonucleotide nucleotidyltransferase [Candidatus Woesebacteria bacterium]
MAMPYPTYPTIFKKDILVGDKKIAIEIGHYSEQVTAVLVTLGETSVHTTVALGRKVNLGYFPLSVEFAEKLFSAGIIKGSRWVKRDGRPTDDVILKARVVDRSLRPMFPDGMTNEVQIINTVFSYDGENDPDMLGLLGSCLAVMISEIPFDGPLAGLRIGYSKEKETYVINPTITERKTLDLDMTVSGNGNAIVMVEAGAKEVSEAVVVEALVKSQEIFAGVCSEMEAIVSEVGKTKVDLVEIDEVKVARIAELKKLIKADYSKQIHSIVTNNNGGETIDTSALTAEIAAKLNVGKEEADAFTNGEIGEAIHSLTKEHARSMIIDEKIRPDGRKTDEIRPIWCEVDVFPRPHGSAMFKRGQTQVVTITTLGAPSLGQSLEGIKGDEVRHYMHHYNMPPYASGEAGRFGAPKRREIGHGALAERALLPMIPSQEEFPYAIHVVSEVMSSNGSTSQASVCGSTMSLMAAGVPLKRPVAGIAMGLMSDGKNYVVLSDIQGLEDHVGDMDFKVAGTADGITAIQMDIKLKG